MSQSNHLEQSRNQNLAVVANLTELGALILDKVAGNEIANTQGGQLIGGQALREMLAAKLAAGITKKSGG